MLREVKSGAFFYKGKGPYSLTTEKLELNRLLWQRTQTNNETS
ncbi:MAG: hypothetical protein AB9895_01670 [Negativicutes bacterium]